ncbi:L-cystine transporter [Paenibacillus larvae]|uniref:L-cystine uptake protein TcyP n=1 Tax=Paenibacillus larvae TaxID=1464 RepID=A0AAP5N5I8_9BACL|nr:L-cystine transporter [Paenibacillus larvae]AQR77104.1 L-cystine transporter [Paenibacillus larvae subsp. larvae]AVF21949.1 DAACS family dicarboxylate/amino acid:cation symporter [Paenibacillus larvae subsp. larvae]ETK27273.1 L-cystine uptake protein TcyP [Paenibacillus larvae subsp. larvae DSM 25719]MCY7488595.1 L-cystine transporter [Paenibacillus larvae]MCY9563175.1 L-cystine transporter [Paenibacillus larvae]
MDTMLLIILNIVVMLVMVGVLYYMQSKFVSFSKRVFTGLGMGIMFGLILQFVYDPSSEVIKMSTDWFNIIGNGYVSFLKMIIMPLIMVSIISAIANLKSSKGLGKMSAIIIGILIFTTMISAVVGITSANIFGLNAEQIQAGEAEHKRGELMENQLDKVKDLTIPQKVLQFIPENPFKDMTGARSTSTLGVVIFSAFIGVAALQIRRKKPVHAEMFQKMTNAVYAVVMRIVTLILRLTPYGVLALMTNTIAKTNIKGIINLSSFVMASYVAIIIIFIIHLILVSLVGLNPFTFVKKIFPTLTFAFTARTSAGAIPLNVEAQTKHLGVPDGIANFAASLGASIGQNGCAGIYPAMLAVMIAPTVGINPLDPFFIIQLVVIVAISSFGVAGVGGGATFAALIVLSAMNMPVGLAGLLISIEPLIDMGRTALNVSGSMTAGTVTAKMLGEMDLSTYNDIETLSANATERD